MVITNIITYKYDNLQNDINRLTHMNLFYAFCIIQYI